MLHVVNKGCPAYAYTPETGTVCPVENRSPILAILILTSFQDKR
jgi:hypothetical protein